MQLINALKTQKRLFSVEKKNYRPEFLEDDLKTNVFCVPFFLNVFVDSHLKLQLNFQCFKCAVQVTLPNVSCFTRSKQNYRCTTLAIADTLVRLQTPITLQKCSIPIRYSVTSFHFFLQSI